MNIKYGVAFLAHKTIEQAVEKHGPIVRVIYKDPNNAVSMMRTLRNIYGGETLSQLLFALQKIIENIEGAEKMYNDLPAPIRRMAEEINTDFQKCVFGTTEN
jgi:hypothetical protein